jgi:hypothetical protein
VPIVKKQLRTPKSQLEPYIPHLKELFDKQPPHTVNQAIDMIEKETGVSLKNSACRKFHDEKLQPRLEKAKQGKRTVCLLMLRILLWGIPWDVVCFTRKLLQRSLIL